MNKAYQFDFFGAQVSLKTNSRSFASIVTSRTKQFKHGSTHQFGRQTVRLIFIDHSQKPELTTTTSFRSTAHQLMHHYLATRCRVSFQVSGGRLSRIRLDYYPSLLFKLLNIPFRQLFIHQLFQEYYKLYVEQSLLWLLVSSYQLKCLHAAAVEKNGAVFVFCGPNGVGKSTLVQYLILQRGYRLFADNYLLIRGNQAYFSPDTVRLSKSTFNWLRTKPGDFFGFGKYGLADQSRYQSPKKIARIKAIYLVTPGQKWQVNRANAQAAQKQISSLQLAGGDEISRAPVVKLLPTKLTKLQPSLGFPDCSYYILETGILEKISNLKI